METVIYLSDNPYDLDTELALHKTFSKDVHLITATLDAVGRNSPVEQLKWMIEREGPVAAVALDAPVSVLESLMKSRFYLGVPLYCPVFERDKFGWPTRPVRFEEMTQLVVVQSPRGSALSGKVINW